MNITLTGFQDLTFVVFFFYAFIDTKIYLALWAAIFHLITVSIKSFFVNDATIYKAVISAYVVIILAGYLYRFRGVLLSDKKTINNGKWAGLSVDKKRQRRIGIAILLLIAVNVAIIIYKRN